VDNTHTLRLGGTRPLDGSGETEHLRISPDDLATHGVIVGMTGSGKTGLAMVMVEEALRAQVPVLMIDVKGDLPNLFLSFPSFAPEHFAPWLDASDVRRAGVPRDALAERLARERATSLAEWKIREADVRAFADSIAPRLITPGTHAGEMLHVLSSLERPTTLWQTDEDLARASLSASLSLVLRLLARVYRVQLLEGACARAIRGVSRLACV